MFLSIFGRRVNPPDGRAVLQTENPQAEPIVFPERAFVTVRHRVNVPRKMRGVEPVNIGTLEPTDPRGFVEAEGPEIIWAIDCRNYDPAILGQLSCSASQKISCKDEIGIATSYWDPAGDVRKHEDDAFEPC